MRWLLLGALALAACTPDITTGTYYCGDEALCPTGLQCDAPTATCVYPQDVHVFTCPTGSNAAEPDDDVASAADIGTAGCGGNSISDNGCIDNTSDVDHALLTMPADCDGHLDLLLRYPVAFMPLSMDLLDAAGNLVVAGEICGSVDSSAQVTTCLTATVDAGASYVIRVQAEDAAPDCSGACAYNRYQLSIL